MEQLWEIQHRTPHTVCPCVRSPPPLRWAAKRAWKFVCVYCAGRPPGPRASTHAPPFVQHATIPCRHSMPRWGGRAVGAPRPCAQNPQQNSTHVVLLQVLLCQVLEVPARVVCAGGGLRQGRASQGQATQSRVGGSSGRPSRSSLVRSLVPRRRCSMMMTGQCMHACMRARAHRLLRWMSLVTDTLLFSLATLMDSPSMPARPSTLILSARNFWKEAARAGGARGEGVFYGGALCGPCKHACGRACVHACVRAVQCWADAPISIILSSTGLLQSMVKEKVCAHERGGGWGGARLGVAAAAAAAAAVGLLLLRPMGCAPGGSCACVCVPVCACCHAHAHARACKCTLRWGHPHHMHAHLLLGSHLLDLAADDGGDHGCTN